ncbi:diguanylate cyclase [Duganella sp. FT27W]|nr:diguanylate cyclase [Duganella sp. FT27W]
MDPAAPAPSRQRRLLASALAPALALAQSPRMLSALVLAVSLGLTGLLWRDARNDADQELQADFEVRVRELVNQLDQRMQTYVQVLYGVQGLFYSSEEVTRREFRTYLEGQGLARHSPGVQSIGYMQLVPGGARAAHEAAVRREPGANPSYHIYPAGERAWYAPTVYSEPPNPLSLRALGFDAASEPLRRAALDRARDTGLPAMTGAVRLLDDLAEAPRSAFLMLLPLYSRGKPVTTVAERRAALTGWVFAPFRVGDLMVRLGTPRTAGLAVEVHDGESATTDNLVYRSAGATGAVNAAPVRMRSSIQQLSLGGHRWTLRIAMPHAAHVAATDRMRLIALCGALLSVLAACLTWALARGRVRAHQALARSTALAAELKEGQGALLAMADSARRSQTMLRSILDSTVDGILADDFKGSILNANRRFRELWNVPEYFDWDSDGAVLMAHLRAQLSRPEEGQFELAPPHLLPLAQPDQDGDWQLPEQALLRLKDGRVIEQHTRGLQLGREPARIWSFRDVTERVHGERREQTRRRVLELLATGAPLKTILESVVAGVETDNEELLCSVLLLDEQGEHLLVAAAPGLPPFFNAAIHGTALHGNGGPCVEAVLSGRRVVVEDLHNAPAWMEHRDIALRAGIASGWSDPIFGAGGAVIGTFSVYQREARQPSMANIALIEQAARLAGIAIEQAQAAQAVRAGEARFRRLYDHAPVALWQQDWSALHTALAELTASGIDDMGRYLEANPSQVARLAALVRIVDLNAAARRQVGAGPQDLAAITLAQNFEAAAMPAFAQALAALARGEHFFVCEGSFRRLDGVMRHNELTLMIMPGHTDSLDFVIVSTVDTTEKRRMHDELRVLATTDFLTGLANRREFMHRLADEEARLRRDIGACTAVLQLDIDHFKRINDEHGHAAGDAVLRQLGVLMLDEQRKIDMVGRMGGEEFAMLLPGTTLPAAAVFAERLRQRVALSPLQLGSGVSLHVTVSIGISVMGGKLPGGDAALIRADQALYRAKRAGRNRVELQDGIGSDRPGLQTPAASD